MNLSCHSNDVACDGIGRILGHENHRLGRRHLGVLTAYFLSKDGHDVTVIERHPEPAMETSLGPRPRVLRLQRQLVKYRLLIIGELGFVPLSKIGAELLFGSASATSAARPR